MNTFDIYHHQFPSMKQKSNNFIPLKNIYTSGSHNKGSSKQSSSDFWQKWSTTLPDHISSSGI